MSYAGNGLSGIGQLLGVSGGVVLLALIAYGIWREVRKHQRWRCPACMCKRLDWQGSGTRVVETRTIEYRTYKCSACSERLVSEAHGTVQRLDEWTPGQPPRTAPQARVVSRR